MLKEKKKKNIIKYPYKFQNIIKTDGSAYKTKTLIDKKNIFLKYSILDHRLWAQNYQVES